MFPKILDFWEPSISQEKLYILRHIYKDVHNSTIHRSKEEPTKIVQYEHSEINLAKSLVWSTWLSVSETGKLIKLATFQNTLLMRQAGLEIRRWASSCYWAVY